MAIYIRRLAIQADSRLRASRRCASGGEWINMLNTASTIWEGGRSCSSLAWFVLFRWYLHRYGRTNLTVKNVALDAGGTTKAFRLLLYLPLCKNIEYGRYVVFCLIAQSLRHSSQVMFWISAQLVERCEVTLKNQFHRIAKEYTTPHRAQEAGKLAVHLDSRELGVIAPWSFTMEI